MTLPGFPGLQLVADHGTVQQFSAVDGDGLPVTVLVLAEHAARDPQLRAQFVGEAMQAAAATLPGELPISVDAEAPRPWAASHRHEGAVGVERLLPRMPAPAPPPGPGPWGYRAPSRAPLVVGLAGLAVLLVVGLAAALVIVGGDGGDGGDEPVAAPAPPSAPLPSGLPPPPSFAPPEPAPRLEGPEPQLRDVPPVAVLGPVFPPDADTYTFAFDGWPFAFRAPSSWGCLIASGPLPDAYGYVCIDEQNPDDRQRATVVLRRCLMACTPAEQEQYNRDWLDEPDRAVPFDPTTVYVETPSNDRGLYSVDFSHFFAEEPGGPLAWQIGVYVESPPETRDEVLMVLNDIRSQTP